MVEFERNSEIKSVEFRGGIEQEKREFGSILSSKVLNGNSFFTIPRIYCYLCLRVRSYIYI